jgi:hypothetical protein
MSLVASVAFATVRVKLEASTAFVIAQARSDVNVEFVLARVGIASALLDPILASYI